MKWFSGRPLPVAILSGVAFAVTPAIILLSVGFAVSIFKRNELPSIAKDGLAFFYFWILFLLETAAYLTLAGISFTAGRELWNLKDRGRRLANVAMVLYGLLGLVFFVIREKWSLIAGPCTCAFALLYLIYLQLPATRRKFEVSSRT